MGFVMTFSGPMAGAAGESLTATLTGVDLSATDLIQHFGSATPSPARERSGRRVIDRIECPCAGGSSLEPPLAIVNFWPV